LEDFVVLNVALEDLVVLYLAILGVLDLNYILFITNVMSNAS